MFSASKEIETIKHGFQEPLCIFELDQESGTDCCPLETAATSVIVKSAVTRNIHVNFIMKFLCFFILLVSWGGYFPIGEKEILLGEI